MVKIPRTIYLFLQWGESKDIPGNRRWIRGAKGVGKAHTDKTNEKKIPHPEMKMQSCNFKVLIFENLFPISHEFKCQILCVLNF